MKHLISLDNKVPKGKDHLVITIHGIRTYGHWQQRLEDIVINGEHASTDVNRIHFAHYQYGYFSLFAFLIPFIRSVVTRRFRKEFHRISHERSWSRIDLVGHSFGTHIIAWALMGMKAQDRPSIDTIILAGSVLRPNFYWGELLGQSVSRVINECGTRDNVLLLSQFVVLLTGMAGRTGFVGFVRDSLRNRYFNLDHSGYFEKNGKPDDSFMTEYWVPLLRSDAPAVTVADPRSMESLLQPAELLRRMKLYCDDEVDAGRLPKHSMAMLKEAFVMGEFERRRAPEITGYQERRAREILSELLRRGLLVSTGPKKPVRLGFPLEVVERWFPALYPIS